MKKIRAKAVIGAGYGDEGKGVLTDLLAAKTADTVVVRSNGGAQAGHTVVTPQAVRHVFHHIGSGALAGAATHFSRHFVAHPMLLLDEWQALRALGADLRLSTDPRALVTTPFDVMINQAIELARGQARHGSTGVGFGETIERNLRPEFRLTTQDLFKPDFGDRLRRIRADWVATRLAALGVANIPAAIAEAMADDDVIERFTADCESYVAKVELWPDRRLGERGNLLFEAAQGLLLDQDYGAFPHVTRSNTGLRNMLQIAEEAGIGAIEATYVTRCYTTRHGAGPLAGEIDDIVGIVVDDPTNAPNDWQGVLRLAPLDTEVLRKAIAHDVRLAAGTATEVAAGLAVTCLDQASGVLPIRNGAASERITPEEAAATIARHAALPLFGQNWGPGRPDFRQSQPVGLELA
ncbi:MAG TPA: adenylosuccinate synthetase [Devosiaceae bacterium]|jgi:adenylosuccinate synthase